MKNEVDLMYEITEKYEKNNSSHDNANLLAETGEKNIEEESQQVTELKEEIAKMQGTLNALSEELEKQKKLTDNVEPSEKE